VRRATPARCSRKEVLVFDSDVRCRETATRCSDEMARLRDDDVLGSASTLISRRKRQFPRPTPSSAGAHRWFARARRSSGQALRSSFIARGRLHTRKRRLMDAALECAQGEEALFGSTRR